jgi:hypothetical protein
MVIFRCERIHLSAKISSVEILFDIVLLKSEILISFGLEFETLCVLTHFEAMEDH